jgi:hypothetical protein
MCRLLIVVQDGTVALLHKSLKDFLLRGKGRVVDERSAHAAYCCLDLIIGNFKDFDIYEYTQESHSFLFYSALYWSQHASLAHDGFHILQSQSIFFEAQSSVRDSWQSFLSYHKQGYFLGDSLIELANEWGCLPIVNYILTSPGLVGDIQDLLVQRSYPAA